MSASQAERRGFDPRLPLHPIKIRKFMKTSRFSFLPLFLFCALLSPTGPIVAAPGPGETKGSPIADKTAGTEKLTGYFNLYWDAKAGRMWLEIPRWDSEFLYVNSLPAGVGSNDIGLDRG